MNTKKIILSAALLLALAIVPLAARGETVADLQARLAELLKQVEALQAQIKAVSSGEAASPASAARVPAASSEQNPALCLRSSASLSRGATDVKTGGAVSSLQQFLKSEGDYTYPTITGYFGPVTEQAVQKWQEKQGIFTRGKIISIINQAPATTGYGVVGPMTRTAIAARCGGPTPSPTVLKPVPVTVPPIEIEIEPSATSGAVLYPLAVLLPRGGEGLVMGSTTSLVWSGTVPNPPSEKAYNLYLLSAAPAGPPKSAAEFAAATNTTFQIATNYPRNTASDKQSYSWVVGTPADPTGRRIPLGQYYFYVCPSNIAFGEKGCAINANGVFEIISGPTVTGPAFICPADGRMISASQDFLGMGIKNITYRLGPDGHGIGDPIYPAVAQYLKDADVKWALKQIPLASVEPQEGQFNWVNHDALFRTWSAAGSRIVGTFGFKENPVEWAADKNNPLLPRLDAWDAYVRAVVKRYGAGVPVFSPTGLNVIRDWETWGEAQPNKYTASELIPVHNTAYAAVKALDPNARVWGPAMLFTPSSGETATTFLREFIAKANFDVLSIHLYMDTPEEQYAKVQEVRALLAANNKKLVPIAVTEFNTVSQADRCDTSEAAQNRQAKFLAETYSCLANAGVEKAFWFTVTDWYAGSEACADGIHRVGVLTTAPKPKKAYETLDALGSYLRGLWFGQ